MMSGFAHTLDGISSIPEMIRMNGSSSPAGAPESQKIRRSITIVFTMGGHKHIERCIGAWIASRYRSAAEVGAGNNFIAAWILRDSGVKVFCTDIQRPQTPPDVPFFIDDIFSPDTSLYLGVDLIYSIRPGEEMMPALIRLARDLDRDLVVYHLGFEGYGRGGEVIDCGVPLHRYCKSQKPSKRVF
jgi:hypothetical protein